VNAVRRFHWFDESAKVTELSRFDRLSLLDWHAISQHPLGATHLRTSADPGDDSAQTDYRLSA
jgi:hypothetical protein